MDRQGGDAGMQYRSIVYYEDKEQADTFEALKKKFAEDKVFSKPIVTKLEKAQEFFRAEDYHQNYYNEKGSSNPYCQIIPPKLEKVRKLFKEMLA
jgi:peptide-methionine (S)-S-oxide reductase